MATLIQIDQTPLVAGTPGSSREDLVLGTPVVLTAPGSGAGSYSWVLVVPPGSSATLSGGGTDTATFTPDVRGTYLAYLVFDGVASYTLDADNNKISTQGGAGVKMRKGVRPLGVGETFQFAAVNGWAEDFAPYFETIDAVDQAKGAALGTIFYADADGDLDRLAPGAAGQLLQTNGAAIPSWVTPFAGTLQASYDSDPAIITGAGGAVAMSRALGDAIDVLTLDKSPPSAFAGSALAITMGLQSTGPAINVDNLGADAVINATGAFAVTVASAEAVRWNANLDQLNKGSLFLQERASEAVDIANYGQIWAKTDQTLWFTDSIGADRQLDLGANLESLGVTTYTSMQHARDTLASTGVISGGGITDDTDGSITVAAGTGLIRATDDPLATIYNMDWATEAGANVALVDGSMNYVYVEYNAGAPRVIAQTTKSTDKQTKVLLATIYRIGITLHISAANHRHINDHLCLMIDRLTQTEPFERGAGGVIGETGTRNFSLTAGTWWQGTDTFSTSAFDSSGVDTFVYIYRDGVGGWTSVAASTQIDNTKYDDGGGPLATLANNQYGVHWEYLGQDGDVYTVYGRDTYTLDEAKNSLAPSDLPPWFAEHHVRIVGRIIVLKNDTGFTLIESPFTTEFAGAAPTDHGSLIGLQDVDDHPDYLLLDGSRAMTGGLTANADADESFILGRARLDSRTTDTVNLSHYDWTGATQYGVQILSTGELRLNSRDALGRGRLMTGDATCFIWEAAYLRGASGGTLRNATSSDSVPVLLTNYLYPSTGIGGVAASDELALITGGTAGLKIDALQDAYFAESVNIEEGNYIWLDADRDTGIFSNGDDNLLLWVAGAFRVQVLAGHVAINTVLLRPNASLTSNLGATGARWKDAFVRSLDVQYDAIGTAETVGALIANTTDSALGAQQFSPMLEFQSSGYESLGAVPQDIKAAVQLKTVQGVDGNDAWGRLHFKGSVDGAAYGDMMTVDTDGNAIITGTVSTSAISATGGINAGGDIDAAGGFRRCLGTMFSDTQGPSATVTLDTVGNNAASRETLGWSAMARAGSIVEIAVWGTDVTAGQADFWVEKSTDGGDAFVPVWGSSGTPLVTLDSTTNPEVTTATQAKDLDAFAAGDILRIRCATNGTFASSGIHFLCAQLTVEC